MAPALSAGVIEAELGRPPTKIFREWDPVPLAAASIGQVHRAVTADGREVAVKVQYPGVAAAIEADLANTEMLARLLPMMFPALDAKVLATELRDRLTEELDYIHEAANQRQFCDIYRGHPFIHIPEVVDELSTPMVLTTELATGARFAEVEQWSAHERDLAGETLFRFVFRGINRLGVFNGDPHPGNYLFRPGGQITFLDFGLVKEFAPDETAVFHRLIETLVLQGSPEGYRRTLESVGLLRPDPSLSTEEVAAYFSHFYDLVMVRGRRTVEHEYASETVRRVFNSKSRWPRRSACRPCSSSCSGSTSGSMPCWPGWGPPPTGGASPRSCGRWSTDHPPPHWGKPKPSGSAALADHFAGGLGSWGHEILHRLAEEAELIALRIREHNPGCVRRLTHVNGRCPEILESLELVRSGDAVGPNVEMQSILHRLGFRDGEKVDDRPSSVGRGDAHSLIGLLDDFPSKDRAPEVSHRRRIERVDDNIGEATRA